MLHKFSERLTSFFIIKKQINSEEREVYEYCFELLLATLFNGLLILLLGIIFGILLETIIFITVFVVLRQLCGGFHANSHMSCIMSLLLIYIGLWLLLFMSSRHILIGGNMLFFVSLPVCLALSPIDCINRPIDKNLKYKLKRKLKVVAVILFIVYMMFIATELENLAFCLAYAIGMVTVLLIMGIPKRNKLNMN